MNFAKDMVAEQETLLRALNQRHLENKVVKKIGTEMANKMDFLKTHLKVNFSKMKAWFNFILQPVLLHLVLVLAPKSYFVTQFSLLKKFLGVIESLLYIF